MTTNKQQRTISSTDVQGVKPSKYVLVICSKHEICWSFLTSCHEVVMQWQRRVYVCLHEGSQQQRWWRQDYVMTHLFGCSHWHRWSIGTSLKTSSTCLPQPDIQTTAFKSCFGITFYSCTGIYKLHWTLAKCGSKSRPGITVVTVTET